MAQKMNPMQDIDLGNPDAVMPLVRAALGDEQEYLKARGLDPSGPGFGDMFLQKMFGYSDNINLYNRARNERDAIRSKLLGSYMDEITNPVTVGDYLRQFPNAPIPTGADKGPIRQVEGVAHGPGAPVQQQVMRTIGMPVSSQLVPPTFDIDQLQPNTVPQRNANTNAIAMSMSPGELASGGLQKAIDRGMDYTRMPFNHQEPTMVPVQVPGTETVEGPRPTGVRDEGGVDMNYPLPRAFRNLMNQYQHREGLRGTQPRTAINDAERKLMLDNRLRALRTGAPADYPEELEDIKQALGYYANVAPPGSNEARKVGGEADKAVAEGHVAPELERAKLAEVRARTRKASAEAAAEEDMLDLKMAEIQKRIEKMDFDMSIGQQRAEIAKLAREADLSGHLFRYMKWLSASGNVRPEDIPVMVKAIVEKVAPYLEVESDSPRKGVLGSIQDFLGVPNSVVTVRPRGTGQDFPPATPVPALPTPGSSPAERAIEQPRPTVDLSKAPAGKKKGQVLTKDGKPVATWDGDKWVPK